MYFKVFRPLRSTDNDDVLSRIVMAVALSGSWVLVGRERPLLGWVTESVPDTVNSGDDKPGGS